MKEFITFVCTDSTEIFSKLRSADLNYNLPSLFTDSYFVRGGGGGSNKHSGPLVEPLETFILVEIL